MTSTKRKLRKQHRGTHRPGTWAATSYTLLDELAATSTTAPLPEAYRTYHLERMQQGLAALETQAAALAEDWRVCSDAINLMETLVNCGPWATYQGQLVDVVDSSGLLREATDAMVLVIRLPVGEAPPPGLLHSVRMVLEDYAEAIGVLSHRSMVRCHRMTAKRIAGILRGDKKDGDVVVVSA